MSRYFLKEVVSNKIWLQTTGAPVPWEPVGDDTGIFTTDNTAIANELDMAVARGVGGVVIIDEAQYQEYKKKANAAQSPLSSLHDRFSLSGLNLPLQVNPGSRVAAIDGVPLHGQLADIPKETPKPIEVVTTFERPRTGKFFRRAGEDASK